MTTLFRNSKQPIPEQGGQWLQNVQAMSLINYYLVIVVFFRINYLL